MHHEKVQCAEAESWKKVQRKKLYQTESGENNDSEAAFTPLES